MKKHIFRMVIFVLLCGLICITCPHISANATSSSLGIGMCFRESMDDSKLPLSILGVSLDRTNTELILAPFSYDLSKIENNEVHVEGIASLTDGTNTCSIPVQGSAFVTQTDTDLYTLIGTLFGMYEDNVSPVPVSVCFAHNSDYSATKAVLAIGACDYDVDSTVYIEFGEHEAHFTPAYKAYKKMITESTDEANVISDAREELTRINTGITHRKTKNYTPSTGTLHAFSFFAQQECMEGSDAIIEGKGGGNYTNALAYIKNNINSTASSCIMSGYEMRLYCNTSGYYTSSSYFSPATGSSSSSITFIVPYITSGGSWDWFSVNLTVASYTGSIINSSNATNSSAKWTYFRSLGTGLAGGNNSASNLSTTNFKSYTSTCIGGEYKIRNRNDLTSSQNVTVYGIGYAKFGYIYLDNNGYENNTTWTHSLNSGNYYVKFYSY